MSETETTTGTRGAAKRNEPGSDVVRKTDRWLVGLVGFFIALQLVTLLLGFTNLSRQSRATCYQLKSIEQSQQRESELARTDHTTNRAAHQKSADALLEYASGLRAIVPGCPKPDPPQRR